MGLADERARIHGSSPVMASATPMPEPPIDVDRIERRLDAIWEIGRTERGGVTRLAYSDEETEAIEYVISELDDRFAVETDQIGNVFAETEPGADEALYLGSHLDSVHNGGRLDGVLGVVCALEAIEAALDAPGTPPVPPGLAIFRAEESARFGQATVGSRGALGLLRVEDLSAQDQSGVPLWQAIQQAGFRPTNLSEPSIDVDRLTGYLELHIEQGRVLDETGDAVGVVTSIRAPVRYRVTVLGSDDHSGATPMGMRRDALAAAARLVSAVETIATEAAEEGDVVATVGDIDAPDGAMNKVCGEVTFPVDIRSNDVPHRDRVERRVLEVFEDLAAERDIELELEEVSRSDPVELDEDVLDRLDELAASTETTHRRLPSGGGHDAMNFQQVGVPTGMLFVPSVDGVSHSPREATRREAVRDATTVLARSVLEGLD